MKLFGDRLSLEDSEWIRQQIGSKPSVLAWGASEDGVVVALSDRLMVRRGDVWDEIPWHDVLSGGWKVAEQELHWRRVSTSESSAIALTSPGRIPEVFRERVEATILVQRVVQAGPGRSITLTGRRPLGEGSPHVQWTAHPAPGVRMEGETLEFVEEQLARLRAEYAF